MDNIQQYSIAAVICTFDRSKYIDSTILSILSQTCSVDEIIIIESGSKSRYHFYSDQYAGNPLIKIFYMPDLSLGAARNATTTVSKSDILVFGDDDDIWKEDRVEEIVLHAGRDDPMVFVHYYDTISTEDKGAKVLDKISVSVNKIHNNLISNKIGGGSSFAVRRETLKAIPFDGTLKRAEDVDWWIRIIIAGTHVCVIDKVLVSYRVHSDRMSGISYNAIKGEWCFWRKYVRLAYELSLGVIAKLLRIIVMVIFKR